MPRLREASEQGKIAYNIMSYDKLVVRDRVERA